MNCLTLEQGDAVDVMLSRKNVFLTGRGGTGKSSIIRAFCEHSNGNVVCLAPTGIAARNLPHGVTIHNFSRLSPTGQFSDRNNRHLELLYQAVDTILIDEISMVRSDIFSLIDQILRHYGYEHLPFGGKQIVTVGDFHQLPPVVDDPDIHRYLESQLGGIYAFNTDAWQQAGFTNIVLHRIHRQTDPEYIELLEAVRHTSPNLLQHLDKYTGHRIVPERCFDPDCVGVCCTREDAAAINGMAINRLADDGVVFSGRSRGDFPEHELPTDRKLLIKRGEKVMLLANQQAPAVRRYECVNGDIGIVDDYSAENRLVTVRLVGNQRLLKVMPATWFNYEYDVRDDGQEGLKLITRRIGSFQQLPLAPAYAMTIHKSQGQTLNKIHLVLGRGCFAYGQLYTALSRVRKLADLTLDRPIQFREALNDPQVIEFLRGI